MADLRAGAMFSNSGRFDRFIRLSCGMRYTGEIDEGGRRLGQIIDALAREAA